MQLIEEQHTADAAQADTEDQPASNAEPAAAAEGQVREQEPKSPDDDEFGADIIK